MTRPIRLTISIAVLLGLTLGTAHTTTAGATGLVAKGKALEAQGQQAEAMGLYEEEIEKEPKDASAWAAMGNIYFKMLNKTEAIRCYDQVLKLRPDDKAVADWLEKYKAAP